MNIKLSKKQLESKIHGCWIGKNIGGTIGGPYEGTKDMLDIDGFSTPKGEPLPNDDLDLQLVWFSALEREGATAMSPAVLGEYWMTTICPHWQEYGVAKSNMAKGLVPPLAGEYCNEYWKYSNGAWIRSELWACLAPGFPNVAIKYAIMDGCIDHGVGEGTYAEIYTAALQSMAFVENDIRKVVEMAVEYIPETSRVAQSVRLVLEEYDKKTNYREVRNMLVKQTEDLGWFQAPANVGYVAIGLLYGEGDFKKSMIYAVNCGDDTDCTAGTVGAVLGIIMGEEGLPKDWCEYIGDKIVTLCINASYRHPLAKSCKELTERVIRQIPLVLSAHEIFVEYTEDEICYDKEAAFAVLKNYSLEYMDRKPYSFDVKGSCYLSAKVEYEKEPVIKAGETFVIRITFRNEYNQVFHAEVNTYLPEGWSAEYNKMVFLRHSDMHYSDKTAYEMKITVGESVQARNDLVISVRHPLSPMPMLIPITLLG
ncbi:MAG: ADP-ribosylglycohydrolase family protein [Lachnospiraceae bacterium]|nr:ADP-ribosylglycohydrolase family protein [Lachnospiraceae bacterium]